MKIRILLVLLLLLLNIVDVGITEAMLENTSVQETNPIISALINNYGWGAVWTYKIVGVLLISFVLALFFNDKAWTRIMFGICVGFSILMIYMFVLFAYLL